MCAASREQPFQPEVEQVELAVEVFRMLADVTRLRLLCALIEEERPVQDLATAVGKAPSAVSQHLAKLRMARLVRTRRDGNQIFYRVQDDHVRALVTDAVQHAEHVGPGVPAHHRPAPGALPASSSDGTDRP